MALVVESFNGTDIQTATYRSYLVGADNIETRAIEPVVVRPAGRNGRFMRSNVTPRIVPVHVEIISGDTDAGQIALAQTFTLGTEGEFLVTYNGTSRALTARVERTIKYDQAPRLFTAVLVAEDPDWHSSALQTVTQQQTVSAATWAVANDGNVADYRGVYTLKPVTAKLTASGYVWKREVVVANPVARPFANYAHMLTLGHAALVTAVKSLASGNDVRIRVDGVETPRWVNTSAGRTWNTATCDIWWNMTLSPGKFATLFADTTAAVPANGADLEVVRGGTSGWPRTGVMLIDDEVITYTGISTNNANGREAFTGITRAARNTVAAIHTTTDTIYWVERRVQLIYGYSGAGAPDARDEQKPMLDFTDASLSNTSHRWLDFAHATDPRSMQWARRAVNRDDQEPAFIQAATGSPAASMAFVFQSAGAQVGSPLFNQWERDFPSGTDGNIAPTRVVDASLGIQYITLDADGNELKGTIANDGLQLGPLVSAADAHDPGDVYGIRFWAFNHLVAQNPQPLVNAQGLSLPVGAAITLAQQFTVGTEPLNIAAASIYVVDDAVARTLTIMLYSDELDATPVGGQIATANIATSGGGTAEWVTAIFATHVTLQPNKTYFVVAYTAAGAVTWRYQNQPYTGGRMVSGGALVVPGSCFNFRLHGYPAPTATSFVRCDDNCLATDGDDATITSLIVPLLATGIPYIAMLAEQACYWLNSVLSNDTTVQTATFDLICVLNDEIDIDVGARTVKNVTTGEDVLWGCKFSDPDEWIRLAAGSNTFKLTEAGIVRVDVIAETRDRWL